MDQEFLTIELGEEIGAITFKDLDALAQFYEQERKFWSWVQPMSNNQTFQSINNKILNAFIPLKNLIFTMERDGTFIKNSVELKKY